MTLTINGFLGANLALDPKLLPDSVGVISLNQRPGYSDLRPWKVPLQVATVPAGPQQLTIHRMGQEAASDANYWLSFATSVHLTRGFEATDTTERTYYTGSGTPKWTNNILALAGTPYPTTSRELAMPAPITAPTIAQQTAGTGTDESWNYVHTFVNDIGWESAPSPASAAIVAKPGAIINITNLEAAPAGAYGITLRRIYKLKPGTASNEFYFLREIAIGSTSTTDDARALGNVLATGALGTIGSTWLPPPTDGKCITSMWNGMLSILSGKSARICVPYHYYAYPLRYEIQLTETAVAQAVFGQRLLILTKADAVLVQGADPAGLNPEPLKVFQPGVSDRAICAFPDGVAWASTNGLCWYGIDGFRVITDGVRDEPLLSREQWQALTPTSMIFTRYLGLLFIFYSESSVLKGLAIDLRNPSGLYFLETGYNAAFRDPVSDSLYVLDGGNVKKFDAGAALMTATYKSKVFRQTSPRNFSVAEVVASAYPVTIKVWADGVLIQTKTVTSDDTYRLPDIEAEEWQFEVATAVVSTQAMRAALAIDELR